MEKLEQTNSFVNRKYRFTDETKIVDGHVLHRIVAIKDFGRIQAGTEGGFVEKYENLSSGGSCWVADDAMVYGPYAQIADYAVIGGNSKISGSVKIGGFTKVTGKCKITSIVDTWNDAKDVAVLIWGNTVISGDCVISGKNIRISNSTINGSVTIGENTYISHNSEISGTVKLKGAKVSKTTIGPGKITVINTPLEYCKITGTHTIKDQHLISCKTL